MKIKSNANTKNPPDISRVEMVTEAIRSRILDGVWTSNERIPSVRKLRDEFSVSSNTILASLAVLEQEKLIQRENRRGVFVRPRGGTSFSRPVAVLSPLHRNDSRKTEDWVRHVVLGCLTQLAAENLSGHLVNLSDDKQTPLPWQELAPRIEELGKDYGGVILTWAACSETQLHDFIKTTRIPIVKIGRYSHHCRHNYVSIDHFAAGREAGGHVIDRLPGPFIALSGWSLHAFPRSQLICGFFDRLMEVRTEKLFMEVLPVPGKTYEEGATIKAGRKIMLEYLEKNQPPQCVFSVGDEIAIGAMEACKEKGISIPAQTAFIGTSGLDIAHACSPTLAHVRQPMEQLGGEAVSLLQTMYETETPWQLGHNLAVTWLGGGSVAPLEAPGPLTAKPIQS